MSIDDIHDMLIEHMNESSASEILDAVKELVEKETKVLSFELAWAKCIARGHAKRILEELND